ncbi:hypothetical protein AB0O01_11975 [Streptomyces sp. NPDC093252]|uniref:hypothetical protein n=1 Tax=Streptomyces sp. NPDC093252 TaxID=3154980 RepID=UPI0034163548
MRPSGELFTGRAEMTQQDIRAVARPTAPGPRTSADPGRRPLISYVLPVYNEREGITAFHTELTAALAERPDLDYELL